MFHCQYPCEISRVESRLEEVRESYSQILSPKLVLKQSSQKSPFSKNQPLDPPFRRGELEPVFFGPQNDYLDVPGSDRN